MPARSRPRCSGIPASGGRRWSACPDDDLGQRIVAFVVGDADPDALIEFVAQELSVHKRPREVRMVDSLPRNAMGKVLKKELAAMGTEVR